MKLFQSRVCVNGFPVLCYDENWREAVNGFVTHLLVCQRIRCQFAAGFFYNLFTV